MKTRTKKEIRARYIKMTDDELIKEYESLDESLYWDLQMDGSGELGRVIHAHYEPYFSVLTEIMDKRNLWEKIYEPEDDFSNMPC